PRFAGEGGEYRDAGKGGRAGGLFALVAASSGAGHGGRVRPGCFRNQEALLMAFEDRETTAVSTQDPPNGRFGPYGGRFVPETLVAACEELAELYAAAGADPAFWEELEALCRACGARPPPPSRAAGLGEACGGVSVYLKREALNHTGAHKINNSLGQVLLAR